MAENETKLKSQINKTPGKSNILDAVMASSHPFDYGQQNSFGLISPNLQQTATRNFGGQQFPGVLGRSSSHLAGRITPTSSGMPTFQSCMPNNLTPQQTSPNSPSLFSLGHLNQRPLGQDIKRMSGLDVQFGGTPQAADDFSKRERNMIFNIGGSPAGTGISSYGLSHNSRASGNIQNSFSTNPALDLSEFPSLTNRSAQESSNPGMSHNPMAGKAPYVGMVKQPTSESNEFHIHSEDFPALPGSQSQDNNQDNINKSVSHKTSESSKEVNQFLDESIQQSQKRGFQANKGSHVTSVPSGMVTDQFGMVGLLSCIRTAETDPKLVSLALGSDLTTLGLNLNTPDYLYPSFGGPWAEHPCRPQDVDYFVPSEYLVNQNIRDKLAPIKLKQYGEDLLFYLFYNFSGDIMQMAAASELYNRNWRFHKEEKVWITKVPGVVPTERTATYERSMYYFFDPETWRKVAKEFHLEYDRLEERAMTPPAVQVLLSGQPARMA